MQKANLPNLARFCIKAVLGLMAAFLLTALVFFVLISRSSSSKIENSISTLSQRN